MIKNTPEECMGTQPLWKKLQVALGILSNPFLLLLDKLGLVQKPMYTTSTGVKFYTRGKTTDVNDAVVVLSGNEYPIELLGLANKSEPAVIDCGGHIGTFTMYLKNLYPKSKIWAFEPVLDNRILFEQNLKLNQIDDVVLLPKALHGSAGTFYIDLSGKEFDAVSIQVEKPSHNQFLEIEAITLAEFIQSSSLTWIDLLKLDVEGSEYNIFEHSMPELTAHVGRVIMEYHPAGDKTKRDEIYQKFISHGWELIYETKNILGFENLKHD